MVNHKTLFAFLTNRATVAIPFYDLAAQSLPGFFYQSLMPRIMAFLYIVRAYLGAIYSWLSLAMSEGPIARCANRSNSLNALNLIVYSGYISRCLVALYRTIHWIAKLKAARINLKLFTAIFTGYKDILGMRSLKVPPTISTAKLLYLSMINLWCKFFSAMLTRCLHNPLPSVALTDSWGRAVRVSASSMRLARSHLALANYIMEGES